jgi:hypothetical protein
MPDNLFWDILDENRKKILPLFGAFKKEFYLAGGTGLALQLGHRDSIDFDFFTDKSFSTTELYAEIEKKFQGHKILKTQDKKDTLTVLVGDSIKISFFAYPYNLVKPLIETDSFNIASVEDIGCMKLSAITSRMATKDYVDLYFILQQISLPELLEFSKEKFPSLDVNLALKSLVYFDDIIDEPIAYKHDHQIDFSLIKDFLKTKVKEYLEHE